MYNPGQELSSLAFDRIIGGALDAVIKAQTNSSIATVNFVKSVGFSRSADGNETPVYVEFKYPKEISPYRPATETTKAESAVYQDMHLQVPILTMMPIPFIRIDSTDIEFNVKINTINTTSASEESNTNISSSTKAEFKKWWSPVSVSTTLNASFASQKKTSSTEEIKKEFSLNIKVHAVQDEVPVGMGRLLDILEQSIISLPPQSDPAQKKEDPKKKTGE